MKNSKNQKVALITGSAGFIGFHVSRYLLDEGWRVIGLDCLTDFYEVSLKKDREAILLKSDSYKSIHKRLEANGVLKSIFEEETPSVVIHLAAQAGVRYSIDNPRAYIESNVVGTFELLEAARACPPKHMLLASTSSIYGAKKEIPYLETARAEHQLSIYAATKKATENLAHSYSYLFGIPITMMRFFTVYGPWGRPDMALFKFTQAIMNGQRIDVYNNGQLSRDFTYIDDIVQSVRLLIDKVPTKNELTHNKDDTLSEVGPFRVVNIGNSNPEKLTDFIKVLEELLGVKASKNFLPMQPGDVSVTWADTKLLEKLISYRPDTSISEGVSKFVKWYKDYYII